MSTDVLTLSQLLSPNFPVGAFAYSHGLEWAIDVGQIVDAEGLEEWLRDLLTFGSARADAVLVALSYRANTQSVAGLDETARAFAASAERLKETDLQGAAFCDTLMNVWGHDIGRLTMPVAVGRAAQVLQLDAELATAMYLQAFVANQCAVAMRLVPLGQTDGQRVQSALMPLCAQISVEVQNATVDDLTSATWGADISAMRHETQHSRVFRT